MDNIPNNQIKSRNTIEQREHEDAAAARRVVAVDLSGNFIGVANPTTSNVSFIRNGSPQTVTEDTSDPSNNRPLPVKLTGFDGDVIINSDNLNLETQLDGVYDLDNLVPDSVGLVLQERGVVSSPTTQTQQPTAIRGTTDSDAVAMDVALRDESGNSFTPSNALPIKVIGADLSGVETYPVDSTSDGRQKSEAVLIGGSDGTRIGNDGDALKIVTAAATTVLLGRSQVFAFIHASTWMDLARYDKTAISVAGDTATIAYYEGGGLLGRAYATFVDNDDWDIQLDRYITLENNNPLLNDGDTELLT